MELVRCEETTGDSVQEQKGTEGEETGGGQSPKIEAQQEASHPQSTEAEGSHLKEKASSSEIRGSDSDSDSGTETLEDDQMLEFLSEKALEPFRSDGAIRIKREDFAELLLAAAREGLRVMVVTPEVANEKGVSSQADAVPGSSSVEDDGMMVCFHRPPSPSKNRARGWRPYLVFPTRTHFSPPSGERPPASERGTETEEPAKDGEGKSS